MKYAALVVSLLVLSSCGSVDSAPMPSLGSWEQLGEKFYRHKDTQNGVVCYMYYPASAVSASLSCVKE